MSKRKYVLAGIAEALTIVADQWTKVMAREVLRPRGRSPLTWIDGFWDMRYSENPGVAFGMLQTVSGGRWILTLVATVAFAIVHYYLYKTEENQTRLHVALGLIGGGAIGNLIDRIMFGRVTDFIVWHVKDHEWPAFNVADAALVVGVILMAWDMLPRKDAPQAPAAPAK